jgi:hypothetical protein
MQPQYRLITSPSEDLFQERLNRFMQDLDPDVVIGEVQFDTVVLPNGSLQFSVLISYKKVDSWSE